MRAASCRARRSSAGCGAATTWVTRRRSTCTSSGCDRRSRRTRRVRRGSRRSEDWATSTSARPPDARLTRPSVRTGEPERYALPGDDRVEVALERLLVRHRLRLDDIVRDERFDHRVELARRRGLALRDEVVVVTAPGMRRRRLLG